MKKAIQLFLAIFFGSFVAPLHAREVPIDASVGKPGANGKLAWYDVQKIGIEGKAWTDTKSYFDRLPARAEKLVRPPVWSLSHHSAGLCVRFVTDAQQIHAKWTLTSTNLGMPHMPATGVSGVDLYVRSGDDWRWLANGRPTGKSNQSQLASGIAIWKPRVLAVPAPI